MIAVIIIAGNTAALAPATICDFLLYIMPPIPTTNIMGVAIKIVSLNPLNRWIRKNNILFPKMSLR